MKLNYIENADCLEGLKSIPDASVDLIVTDPPYGSTRNKWDTVVPLELLWPEFDRVCKENAPVLIFSQQPFTAAAVSSNLKNFRYEWVWEKTAATGHLNAKRMPMKVHENILVFYRKLPVYNQQMRTGFDPYIVERSGRGSSNYGKQTPSRTVSTGDRYPVDILRFKGDRGLHPTQKPAALVGYLIQTYTNPGAVVLDPFMGSGTTAAAAKACGRHYIGFELDRQYYDAAIKRIAEEVTT